MLLEESFGAVSIESITFAQLSKTIDHSLLRPNLTNAEISKGCRLAKSYNVASVCVKPSSINIAVPILQGTDIHVGTVIGFPHGSEETVAKVFEATHALEEGATELDMVMNIGWLRSKQYSRVLDDIQSIVEVSKGRALVKVILENAYLTNEEKQWACHIAETAGANFVKTSTGFAPTGATVADVMLMHKSVSPKVQIKAAGGIQSLQFLIDLLNAGASRIGLSATQTILDEFKKIRKIH